MSAETGENLALAIGDNQRVLRKRWFIQDRVAYALRDSFRAHGIEATEKQIEKVAKDIADDWDRLLD